MLATFLLLISVQDLDKSRQRVIEQMCSIANIKTVPAANKTQVLKFLAMHAFFSVDKSAVGKVRPAALQCSLVSPCRTQDACTCGPHFVFCMMHSVCSLVGTCNTIAHDHLHSLCSLAQHSASYLLQLPCYAGLIAAKPYL